MKTFASLLVVVLSMSSFTPSAICDEKVTTRARQFWSALSKADERAMQKFYADKVTLKAGSELLNKQWAIHKDARPDRDLDLTRAELLNAYRTLIQHVSKELWQASFQGVGNDRITVVIADKADQPFASVRQGDAVMTVKTGLGGEPLIFVFRKSDSGEWLVVAELTDY